MKKHFYLLFALTVLCNVFSFAQCTPNPGVAQGIDPTSANVSCADTGQAFSQVFTFVIPGTVVFNGSSVSVTSVAFTSTSGLPAGLTAAFNKNPSTYAGDSSGCFIVSGITRDACGQYKMLINVTITVNYLGNQIPLTGELSTLASQYGLSGFEPIYIRVKTAAGTCPAVVNNGNNFTADQSCGVSGGVASAVTDPATAITLTSATINGTVNPNGNSTTVSFEYGLTTSYGTSPAATPGTLTGSSSSTVSAALTGLASNTTYHFRVKAVNSAGTTYGNDRTFTTLAPAGACTPNTSQTTPFEPQPAAFRCAIKGSPFTETIFLSLPALAGLLPVAVDSVRIDSLGNLPAGIIGLTNQNDKTYAGSEYGCIQFSGTTNAACGQYRMKIYVTVWTSAIGAISGELSALGAQYGFAVPSYYNRVTTCAQACDTIDNAAADIKTITCPAVGTITQPSIAGPNSFCAGSSISLTLNSTYDSYKWSTGATSQSISVSQATTYTVKVKSGCDSASTTKNVTQSPAPNVAITQTGNVLSVPSNGNSTYQWLKNGVPVNGATSASYTPTASGNYSVDVTLGNCRDTSNAITKTFAGIEDASGLETISIVPNPAKDFITIGIKSSEMVKSIMISDVYGKILREIPINASEINQKIQLEEFANGMYFIQISTVTGTATRAFIMQ